MRTILCGLWVLGGIGAAASIVPGCGSNCSDTGSCGPYTAPNGGGGAVSTGNAGSTGTSGTGHGGSSGAHAGASGTSGDSGTSGGNSAGDSGEAGTGGGGGVPCDSTKSPSVEACVVSDEYAIFVAPTGKDTATGSQAAPVQSIAKALVLAGASKIVIACDGTYDEQVKVTGGVKLYGGFACPDSASPWTYEAGKKAKVAPSARGLALSVAAGASSVVIEDFEFDAKDGIEAGESSVAAFVNASSAVALTRVKLVAGKGVDGASGSLTPVTFPPQVAPSPGQVGLNGHAASGDTGGAFNLVMCPVGGTTKGGVGGNGSLGVSGGGPGAPDLGGGQGGTVVSCGAGGTGKDGANANAQSPAPGAAKLGSITPTGWSGLSGTDGAAGTPGQGGGGGTGAASGGGGGGGGAGGCGGAGGTGGKAGGSSIALLVLNSTVTFMANELVAANAGKGGNGIAGQPGQSQVGNGGVQVPAGCSGGQGGLGGNGGAGGGAAGGISVGIAYVGSTAPAPDSLTTLTTGTAGAKGIGGVPGTNDGIAGVKQGVLQVL